MALLKKHTRIQDGDGDIKNKDKLSLDEGSSSSGSSALQFNQLDSIEFTGSIPAEESAQVEYLLQSNSISYFPDPTLSGRPDPDTRYFIPNEVVKSKTNLGTPLLITTVVPFYNEHSNEMHRCLRSLQEQNIALRTYRYHHKVLCVMDGVEKASKSMKEYWMKYFPSTRIVFENFEAIKKKHQVCTFVFQNKTPNRRTNVQEEEERSDQDEEQDPLKAEIARNFKKWLNRSVTLLVKLDNRKKHNSHEWFFMAFCKEYKAKYAFATDCGTLYTPTMLSDLALYLHENPNTAGVTGRQRVMSLEQSQELLDPSEKTTEFIFGLNHLFRSAQAYDYESSFACYMAAFHLAGMLPVLPGPCGLYNYKHMSELHRGQTQTPLEYYFDIVSAPPEEQDLIIGNLLLAEDRVLSVAAVLKSPYCTAIAPNVVFYFEPEIDFRQFVFQRRRWINGTVAAYWLYAVHDRKHIWNSPQTFLRKLFINVMLLLQVMIYAVVAITPSLFIASLRFSIQSFIPVNEFSPTEDWPIWAWYSIIVFYVIFIVRHMFTNFEAFMFYLLLLINMIIMVLAVTSIGFLAHDVFTRRKFDGPMTVDNEKSLANYYLLVILASFFMPFIIACVSSFKSTWIMIKTFIFFYLFLPTMVSIFPAYSFARTFDLSWGNRPESEKLTKLTKEVETARAEGEKKLWRQSSSICAVIIFANLVFSVVVLISSLNMYAIAGIVVFVLVWSFVQQVVSLIWFVPYRIKRASLHIWRFCTCYSWRYDTIGDEYLIFDNAAAPFSSLIRLEVEQEGNPYFSAREDNQTDGATTDGYGPN